MRMFTQSFTPYHWGICAVNGLSCGDFLAVFHALSPIPLNNSHNLVIFYSWEKNTTFTRWRLVLTSVLLMAIQKDENLALTLSPPNKLSSAKILVFCNFQSASILLKVGQNFVWVSNSFDRDKILNFVNSLDLYEVLRHVGTHMGLYMYMYMFDTQGIYLPKKGRWNHCLFSFFERRNEDTYKYSACNDFKRICDYYLRPRTSILKVWIEYSTVLVLSKLKNINATAPQSQRNALKYFAIFKKFLNLAQNDEKMSKNQLTGTATQPQILSI